MEALKQAPILIFKSFEEKTNSSGAPILTVILYESPNSNPKPLAIGASYSPSDSWVPPPPPLLPLDVPSSLAGAWRPHLADLHGGHQGWNSGHPFTADELAPPRGPPTPIGEAGPPRLELKRA